MRNKSRLTITLPQEILKQVDNLVDGKEIRNRSHAIETLIRSSLTPTVNTAVILAGSKKRQTQPPVLMKVNGKYVFVQLIDHLKSFGITTVVVAAGFYTEQLQAEFNDGSPLGVQLQYVTEDTPMGTAGALKLAAPLLAQHPFLVVHGDILTDIDLHDFIAFHQQEETLATIGVKPRMGEKKYGQAFIQGNKIITFLQTGTTEGISIVNTGLYVLQPEVLKRIPVGKQASLESDVFPELAAEGELSAFIFQGLWEEVSQ